MKAPEKTNNFPFLTLRRSLDPFPLLTVPSCYASVIVWLFQSGIVSYRWYIQHSGASNKTTLTAALGLNDKTVTKVIWKANKPFTAQNTLSHIPRGHIVHLYVDNSSRWNGHWLVSKGDRSACACNNDTEGGRVPNAYFNDCSLDAQFLNGYKHPLKGGGNEQGVAEVIDPLKIPNRM